MYTSFAVVETKQNKSVITFQIICMKFLSWVYKMCVNSSAWERQRENTTYL